MNISPTPYTDVNEILNLLLISVKEILNNSSCDLCFLNCLSIDFLNAKPPRRQDLTAFPFATLRPCVKTRANSARWQLGLNSQFVSMYLYGSLAYGDFNPATSDIDFLVVTTDSLSQETIAELEAMHNRAWAINLKRAGKLEGAYVPQALIRRHDSNGVPCPIVNEGNFISEKLGSDWIIQRHVVREYGIVIDGSNPKTLIDFVSPADIRGAVMGILHEWWFPMLDNPMWLEEHESGDRAFAVITMCRVLHSLEYGTIVSKPKAIQWARAKLDEHWNKIIDQAVAVSQHTEQDISLTEVLSVIEFVKEQTMKPIPPTPYSGVNEILNQLFTGVKEILQGHLVGIYLFGSLANGGFDEHSDIDVLVVTNAEISDATFSALKEMHKRINKLDSPWAIQLEVSYIPQEALRCFDPTNNIHPHMDRGNGETLHMMRHATDWIIQRHILRERGIVITGPELKTLIDPVSPDEMRQAIVEVLPLWINPILENPAQIKSRGYQSFIVLSLCRMLYTLQYGTIVSKQVAAEWGQDTLHRKWAPLIQQAWLGRQNPGLEAQLDNINGTLGLIRYTLEYSKQIETQNHGAESSHTTHDTERFLFDS